MRQLFSTLLLSGFAVAQGVQMPIPAFTSTFFSATFTRGFYFQVPGAAPVILAGLRVPDESAHGLQNVEIVRFPTNPTGVATAGTQLFFATGQPSANVIPTSVVVNPGEWIGIYGACGDATTMRNSYGTATGGFASSVLGSAVNINRLYTQVNIVTNGGQNTGFGVSGPIGRVEVYVTPRSGLFPGFSADVQTGSAPLTVNFTDSSFSSDPGGVVAWIWDFDNDGTPDSSQQNPSFTYATCGLYDVSLTVVDAMHGPQTLVETGFIDVDSLTAGFTIADNGGGSYTFTDTSTSATAWQWDFESDGVIDSTLQNPTHTYTGQDVFTVTMSASNSCRTDVATGSVNTFPGLSTIFLGGNGLSGVGAGNMFDITVSNPNGILVNGLDVAASLADASGTVEVWITPNTSVGNEANAAVWLKVSQAVGVSLTGGTTSQDFANVSDFYLAPGSYGMRVATSGGVRYTNGTGANQAFSNGDISLALGTSNSVLGGAPITPRVWNGSIYYTTTTSDGFYNPHRQGCSGSAGQATMTSAGTPRIGTTTTLEVDRMPSGGVGILILGYGDQTFNGGPLPFDLGFTGMPGCNANIDLESTFLVLANASGIAQWDLILPNTPAFVGTPFWTQTLVLDAGVNGLGAVMSDSAAGRVGN